MILTTCNRIPIIVRTLDSVGRTGIKYVCVCVCGVYRYNVEQVREREHIENIVAVCGYKL